MTPGVFDGVTAPREDQEDTSMEDTASGSSEGAHSVLEELDPILEAFLEMQPRKLRRIRHSRMPRQSLLQNVRTALQLLIMFVLIANNFDLSIKKIGLQSYKVIPWFLTLALIVPTVVQTWCTPEHTFSAWVSTEVHVFCMWTAWEFRDLGKEHPGLETTTTPAVGAKAPCVSLPGFCIPNEIVKIAISFLSVFGTTCALYFVKWFALWATMNFKTFRRLAVLYWHVPRRVRSRPGLVAYTYKPGGFVGWSCSEFAYEGPTDEHGRPHGIGVWSDTSFHGENLRGVWVHGRPAGCFTSRESGTGAQFQQRPVGYITSRGDCQPQDIAKSSFLPHKVERTRYGHGLVEVSFAGGFFPFLPSVEHHRVEPSLSALLRGMMSGSVDAERVGCTRRVRLGSLKLEVVDEADINRSNHSLLSAQLSVKYMEGSPVGYVTSQDLVVAGGRMGFQAKDEALVFIHGYNCELSTALGRIAQTLALGNMGGHIVPFVFSYSGGGVLQYFSAKVHMRQYGSDLAGFLQELSMHFEEVHILTHSCGAEFLFANWTAIEGCFQPSRRQSDPLCPWNGSYIPHGQRATNGDSRLHLATLTLMNPDVLVARVLELLPRMMQVAEHFTTYNDADDGALFCSGLLQRIVPRWYQERPWSESTDVFGKQLKPLWVVRGEDGIQLRGELIRGNMVMLAREPSANIETWVSEQCVPGDGSVDIVNCSTIDQNVHTLRHNYYMLNTQMVEDVCELIGSRLTAPSRRRLCQVNYNIFNFLSPPGHLME